MSAPVAGWYPDPSGSAGQRWWDGYRWTGNIRPNPPVLAPPAEYGPTFPSPTSYGPTSYGPPGYGPTSYGPTDPGPVDPGPGDPRPAAPAYPPAGYGAGPPGMSPEARPASPARASVQRNRQSFIALGVIAAYVVLALTLHIVLFGVLPILFAVRAVRAREPLAIPAAVLSGLVLLFALYEVSR